jgi:hypothetical protein
MGWWTPKKREPEDWEAAGFKSHYGRHMTLYECPTCRALVYRAWKEHVAWHETLETK